MVVAGHRDTFFRPLRDVRVGDDIFVDTPAGSFQYRVSSLRVVRPSDLSVLDPTDEAVLTLITCYPFWLLGNAPDRYVVRAALVSTPPATAAMSTSATPIPVPDSFLEPPVVNESISVTPATPPGDATLVRRAIESYRLTYNVTRYAVGEAPLTFRACDIAVADDEAAATCEPSSRMFVLRRTRGGWAITSIEVQ